MNACTEALADDGERVVPEAAPAPLFWEHIYRYKFAARFVRGRQVLDIACGEGYGTRALREAGAAGVVGIDISTKACAHAHRRYQVPALAGDAARMPLAGHSVDVVVSFETIEHVRQPLVFLDECVRVLRPAGILVLAAPNRDVYDGANPFHISMMSEAELGAALAARFRQVRHYRQRLAEAPWWSVRALAAQGGWWRRVPGYWRVRRLLCPHLQAPGAGETVAPRDRAAPVAAIGARDRPGSGLVNEYVVRPRARWGRERSYFFLAVARL